jgi:hypothetical protein
VKGLVVFLRRLIERRGLFKGFAIVLYAGLLKLAEFGPFLFVAAVKAGFLKLQIAERFLVGEEGLSVDEAGARGGILVFEEVGKLDLAFGVDREFKGRDAPETPSGIGDGLDELGFTRPTGEYSFSRRSTWRWYCAASSPGRSTV